MRQGNLARLCLVATTGKSNHCCRVVRCAERSLVHKAVFQLTGYRVDFGNFQGLLEGHVGHDGWHSTCNHSFTCAWWPNHDDVVTACNGNFHCALGCKLAFDILEVVVAVVKLQILLPTASLQRLHFRLTCQKLYCLAECCYGVDLCAFDKHRFVGVCLGDDKNLFPLLACGNDHWQNTVDFAHFAIQRKFANHNGLFKIFVRDLFACCKHANGNGKVVQTTLLFDIRWSKVNYARCNWVVVATVFDGGTNTLLGLLYGSIGKTNNVVSGHTCVHVYFCHDRETLYSFYSVTFYQR